MTKRTPLGPTLSRRHFIAGAATLTAAAAVLRPAMGQDIALEAPQLADMVAKGELPPLGERLPPNPMVVTPVDGAGQYGGTWNSATTGAADNAWWWRTTGYEGLTRVDTTDNTIQPNVAESWDVTDDGRVFTFKLRPGIKWSDGEPFTAQDVAFWYNDFFTNADLWPAGVSSWMKTPSGPGTVEAVDDTTVVFTFAEPNGFLPNQLASYEGHRAAAMPRHYLEQFHIDYNPNAGELATQEGFNTWVDLFLNRAGTATVHMAAGLPGIRPWQLQTPIGQGTRLVFARNPFYWKTDTNGSQLPYIDEVVLDIIEDPEVMLLKAANGELTYHIRHINTPANKPVLARNMEEKGYTLPNLEPATMNEGVIGLNLNHEDPVKREIYNNKDFRIGLSHALDRMEIINAVYQRQGQPWQASPRPTSKYHNEQLASQYLEHDLDLANEALDAAGYKRNGSGQRIGPDGNPIHIQFLASTTGGAREALLIDVQQIMKKQWAEVGISMDTTPMERSLYITRTGNNEQDALMWTGFGGHDLSLPIDPRFYIPTAANQANWGNKWTAWYVTNGADGEAPPDYMQRQFQLYKDSLATPDLAERDEMLKEMLQISADQFYVIGTTLSLPTYGIKSNDLMNVRAEQPDCWPYPCPAQINPEQFWLDRS